MSSHPRSPYILKGGIVLLNPENSSIVRIITLQYNPDSVTRSLQIQGAGENGERSEALRLTGPPVETYSLEAEIDATDGMEMTQKTEVEVGIQHRLAALETIIYPTSDHLFETNTLAQMGTLEIVPAEAPLTLFVWNKNRVVPVRFTDLSITEEAFDPQLNPIRAKINLSMRVLSVNDLGFDHIGGNLYMNYQQTKEKLAGRYAGGKLSDFGINSIT
ncbi:MAG TPA: hypothetical protein VK941_03990 [Gillisia sp.]|nr:hypothetical protein [Gillisia sp.]